MNKLRIFLYFFSFFVKNLQTPVEIFQTFWQGIIGIHFAVDIHLGHIALTYQSIKTKY